MHVISRKKLREFWAEHDAAERPLSDWFRNVSRITWTRFAELRETYASADQVGEYVVFNLGGNKYRLVAEVNDKSGLVFIREMFTHKEYDDGKP
jgi:mRNA interferase HigB